MNKNRFFQVAVFVLLLLLAVIGLSKKNALPNEDIVSSKVSSTAVVIETPLEAISIKENTNIENLEAEAEAEEIEGLGLELDLYEEWSTQLLKPKLEGRDEVSLFRQIPDLSILNQTSWPLEDIDSISPLEADELFVALSWCQQPQLPEPEKKLCEPFEMESASNRELYFDIYEVALDHGCFNAKYSESSGIGLQMPDGSSYSNQGVLASGNKDMQADLQRAYTRRTPFRLELGEAGYITQYLSLGRDMAQLGEPLEALSYTMVAHAYLNPAGSIVRNIEEFRAIDIEIAIENANRIIERHNQFESWDDNPSTYNLHGCTN